MFAGWKSSSKLMELIKDVNAARKGGYSTRLDDGLGQRLTPKRWPLT